MMGKMNPRQMQQMMKRMGIAQQEVEATEVIIKTEDKEIVFRDPQVSKVNMMGQVTFQVAGEFEEREISQVPELSEEDIKTVVEQTGVSEDMARELLEKNNGDIAETILEINDNN